MRYFQSGDGQSVVSYQDDALGAIEAALASGMVEVPCMHPGAQEIVWRKPDGIAVTTVMPETLAGFEFARAHLALDKQAAADALPVAEADVVAAGTALAEAETLIAQGREASKLRIQVQAHIPAVRGQCEQQLAEVNRETVAAIAQIGTRDAELAAIEASGVQAQAELVMQQARQNAGDDARLAAQTALDAAGALAGAADLALADLQAILAAGTADDQTAVRMAAALADRQRADAELATARTALAAAEYTIGDAAAAIGNLQQFIAQAKTATAERIILVDQRNARMAQDETDKTAIRAAADQAVAELTARDGQLSAVEFAAARAESGMAALQAQRDTKQAALSAAQQLLADIARAEEIAASDGTTPEEHAQRLQARGAVPADWTVHAVHTSEAAWKPAGVELDDLVIDAQGALVADQGKVLARAARKFEAFVQGVLDRGAQDVGYDNIVSACSYAAAPNPFQAESVTFVAWRGAVWAKCYEVLAAVQAGARAVPTEAELLAELPVRGV